MAMIACSECRKQVSDKANACPACGNPVRGGGVSSANGAIVFEKRIEQYKANGYTLVKREGDSVDMVSEKSNMSRRNLIFFAIGGLLLLGGIILVMIESLRGGAMGSALGSAIMPIGVGSVIMFLTYRSGNKESTVTITLAKTGKIEETGNVLKKK